MSKKENSFKKYLFRIMGTRWDAQSHEDSYSLGIPDISFGACGINGWIELKQIPGWMKPKKYTANQVNWLIKRDKRGGHCFIFVKIKDDHYYLLKASKARMVRAGMKGEQYKAESIAYWHKSIDPDQLISALTGAES